MLQEAPPAGDGSSPHARGTPADHPTLSSYPRFIPACAGNAYIPHWNLPYDSVHPRMRGERRDGLQGQRHDVGSSPHARGTQLRRRIIDHCLRFIPACAGNASAGQPRTRRAPVHPRMRGERCRRYWPKISASGSSPHARGTRCCAPVIALNRWFIPACAGNAMVIHRSPAGRSVHPRMRGERPSGMPAWRMDDGSSPHARGTRGWGGRHVPRGRFIPACAGNATMAANPPEGRTVHPRMRGER